MSKRMIGQSSTKISFSIEYSPFNVFDFIKSVKVTLGECRKKSLFEDLWIILMVSMLPKWHCAVCFMSFSTRAEFNLMNLLFYMFCYRHTPHTVDQWSPNAVFVFMNSEVFNIFFLLLFFFRYGTVRDNSGVSFHFRILKWGPSSAVIGGSGG